MLTKSKSRDLRRDRCCLCGKTKEQVRKLIVGLHGAVCSDCIDLCNDILGAEASGGQPSAAAETAHRRMIEAATMVRREVEGGGEYPPPRELSAKFEEIKAALAEVLKRLDEMERRG